MSFLVDPNTFKYGNKSDEEKERLRHDRAVERITSLEPQELPYPKDKYARIRGLTLDRQVGAYDESTQTLTLTGRLSDVLIQEFHTASGGDLELYNFMKGVYQLQIEAYEQNQKDAKASIAAAQNFDDRRLKIMEVVETALKQIRQDQALAAQKRPSGVFEKGNIDSWKFLPLDDAERSRTNLQDILSKKRKDITKIDSEIASLTEEMKPIKAEIAALESQL